MNALDLELALDRLDARLATELPVHVAALARAHAEGGTGPLALPVEVAELACLRAALALPELHARATRIARMVVPIVVEGDPRVAAARAHPPSWDGLRALAIARDTIAYARFQLPMRALVHSLAGLSRGGGADPVDTAALVGAIPPPVDGWATPEAPLDDRAIAELWRHLTRGEPFGELWIARSAAAHARMFAIERGVRGTIVIPDVIDTPASRFTVLHELGHALVWLAPRARAAHQEIEWPRAVDEAAASYVARRMEIEGLLPDGWHSHHAEAARLRRLRLARALDAIEARLFAIDVSALPIARPPWALWHDPHAQASYVAAEAIAEACPPDLRGAALADHLATYEPADSDVDATTAP